MSLRQTIEACDEAALATLANKGLVRRAKKDLERGLVEAVELGEEEASVTVEGYTVRLDGRGPAEARCTCPAAGKCRHLVAAVLCLRERFAGEDGDERPDGSRLLSELLALPLDAVERWAGKRSMARAVRLARLEIVEVEDGASVRVTLRGDREVRFLDGAGLDGALYKGPDGARVASVAAALLGLRARHGMPLPEADGPGALPAVKGALRSRGECVEAVRARFARAVELGLGRRSEILTDGSITLSLSCAAANLPRLAASVRGVARELHRLNARRADADAARTLERIAEADALARALDGEASDAALIGAHRSEYRPLGDLPLVGVGAWRFAAPSGYRGVSVAFFSPADGRFHTWTDTRPAGVDHAFDPDARYRGGALWPGLGPPTDACRRRFVLVDAHGNPEGRLAARAGNRADEVAEATPLELSLGDRGHADWAALRRAVAARLPLGLTRPAPNDALYLVRAGAPTDVRFDEVDQALRADLVDPAGERLTLRLAHEPGHERAVRWLASKSLSAHEGAATWLVRVRPHGAALLATPLSVWLHGAPPRLVNLHLDETPAERRAPAWWGRWAQARKRGTTTGRLLVDAAEDEEPPPPAWSAGTERAVALLEDELLAAAESGAGTRRDPDRLERAIAQLRRRGLERLGDQAAAWSAARDARGLLALRWSVTLHRHAALRVALGG